MKPTTSPEFEAECQKHMDRFYARWPDPTLQKKANKALRFLRASDEPLQGKAEGWAAGLVYFAATDGRVTCGIPGVLNAEFSEFMGVSMETTRRRSGRVSDIVLI